MKTRSREQIALRVGESGAGIPERYFAGVWALADWGDSHNMPVEGAAFRKMRNQILDLCEKWRCHDWDRDSADIVEKKQALAEQGDLLQSINAFQISLGKFRKVIKTAAGKRQRSAESFPPLSLLASDPNQDQNLRFVVSVECGLAELMARVSLDFDSTCRFGPAQYRRPPKLAQKEVVIALTLADRITFWRKDSLQKGAIWTGIPPTFSKDLPWSAIHSFAVANSAGCDAPVAVEGLQIRVQSHAKTVQHLYPFGTWAKPNYVSIWQSD